MANRRFLRNIDVFMGLQAERPFRVSKNILYDFRGVTTGARLQIPVVGVEMQPRIDDLSRKNDF